MADRNIFSSYDEYMKNIFDCVNRCLSVYLDNMKSTFSNGQGGYKNVLYPDLEIASDAANEHVIRFERDQMKNNKEFEEEDTDDEDEDDDDYEDEELLSLLGAYGDSHNSDNGDDIVNKVKSENDILDIEGRLIDIQKRAKETVESGIEMPFYDLCSRMSFDPFTIFCFACGILSSTQTDYSGIFQIVNENGNLMCPTIESAGRLYYGQNYSITGAYGDMSVCLEQLLPVLDLRVVPSMPFSTAVSPDKRIIDFLFGRDRMKIDENYIRFMRMLTKDDEKMDDILCNENVLGAMKIAYRDGSKLFSYHGDEGSGRKFFVRKFCEENKMRAITVNCKKLFVYDYSYVEKAIWAVTRECILTEACCVLEELQYREEEKEKFFGYMDLFFNRLTEKGIIVFANSKETINFKEITKEQITLLELPAPDIDGRIACWNYYSKGYEFSDDVDFFEMATKFLFTPGKIKDAIHYGKSLAVMDQTTEINRATLFKSCNAQMSSELSAKATRVEAKFGFEDIVMNKDQREHISHAIEKMNNKKQVYDDWNYMNKYPYGRGLTVLLYGAPGTGKSMMAQVLAHELNLELYRVDISKVVDKYVGETEKSLSMIFREAKKCNVVLFFDECDTIFAKRSDDGGSNQASANNKTALLLQEMEAYDGVCVLATNYKHNIDPAFFRRMKYIVEFQFPNEDTREMLWTTTVPKTTPLGDDVDFRFIAEKFEFAGGNIKNCVLNAAFLAAEDETAGGKVCMRHYLKAIQYEFVKVGRVFTRADFEPYADMIFGEVEDAY